jgi:hypothetical protein
VSPSLSLWIDTQHSWTQQLICRKKHWFPYSVPTKFSQNVSFTGIFYMLWVSPSILILTVTNHKLTLLSQPSCLAPLSCSWLDKLSSLTNGHLQYLSACLTYFRVTCSTLCLFFFFYKNGETTIL